MKYGRLTLIEKTQIKYTDGTFLFKFICDCGNEKIALLRCVKRGETLSCGCLQAEGASARMVGKCPSNKRPEKERAVSWSFSETKQSAKTRKIEMSLSVFDIANLVFENCYYCDAPPARLIKHTRDCAQVKVPVNGIDRYDNSVGYTKDNSVPCCSYCNYLKRDRHGLDFLKVVKKISENIDSKGRWNKELR